jgi:hypothetical protein
MDSQTEERRGRIRDKMARFPLELLLIAAASVFVYGQTLLDCSPSSSDPPSSARSATSSASTRVAIGR